jgi:hypothetical protein
MPIEVDYAAFLRESPLQAAKAALAELERCGEPTDVAVPDWNTAFARAYYHRAQQCVAAMVRLVEPPPRSWWRRRPARPPFGTDAVVLLRSLVNVVLAGLYLVAPLATDVRKREIQLHRARRKALVEARKTLAHHGRLDGGDPSIHAADIAKLDKTIDSIDAWFSAISTPSDSVSPEYPDDATIAKDLGLDPLYATVYRKASATTHFSLLAVADVVSGHPSRGEAVAIDPTREEQPNADFALSIAAMLLCQFAAMLKPHLGLPIDRRALWATILNEEGMENVPVGDADRPPGPA